MRSEKLEEIKKNIEELKTVRREILDEPNKFLSLANWRYTLANGSVLRREELLKNNDNPSAVIIAPLIKDTNEFVVVMEPRVFTESGVSLGFAAGYIEKGETSYESALRELREETGYVPEELIHLDAFYQDEGVSKAYNHSYLALNCTKKFDQELDESEMVRHLSLTLDEILECEKMGLVNGVNSKLTLCKIKEYMKGSN